MTEIEEQIHVPLSPSRLKIERTPEEVKATREAMLSAMQKTMRRLEVLQKSREMTPELLSRVYGWPSQSC